MKKYDIGNNFKILKLGMDDAIERGGQTEFLFSEFFQDKASDNIIVYIFVIFLCLKFEEFPLICLI